MADERYIYSRMGPVYHDRNSLTEQCLPENQHGLKASLWPPSHKLPCRFCQPGLSARHFAEARR